MTTTPTTSPMGAIELPPLPEPDYPDGSDCTRKGSALADFYTINQMKAYARTHEANVRAAPIDMVLHCPACGDQHIDGREQRFADNGEDDTTWTNPPHRSHLCHCCGHIWRPADVPTNGVAAVSTKGKADSPIAVRAALAGGQDASPDVAKMVEALESIQRYGLDTLSGRTDGPDDREWQRAGVNEMTKRARLGLEAYRAAATQARAATPLAGGDAVPLAVVPAKWKDSPMYEGNPLCSGASEPLAAAASPHAGHPILQRLIDSVEIVDGVACWDYMAMYEVRDALGAAATQARVASLPHPGSPEASAMMDSLLAEYHHPANTKNAARSGWEAAHRWLATQPAPALAREPLTEAEIEAGFPPKRLSGYSEFEAGVRFAERHFGITADSARAAASEPRESPIIADLATPTHQAAEPAPIDVLSDMDRAVLRMPRELAMSSELAQLQFYSRVQSLLNRLDAIAAAPTLTAPAEAPLPVAQQAHPDTVRLDWLLPNLHPANFGMGFEWNTDEEFLTGWRKEIDAAMSIPAPKSDASSGRVDRTATHQRMGIRMTPHPHRKEGEPSLAEPHYLWSHPDHTPRIAKRSEAAFSAGDPLWVAEYPVEVFGAGPIAGVKAPLTGDEINRAARKMAELFDYPWAHMPEQGRETMRQNALAVIRAASQEANHG